MSSLKAVLDRLEFKDDAKVVSQLGEQTRRVQERLVPVRRKLLVMSGKGGVGKSAITSQLAVALARLGQRVGVLDVDLNGPCMPRMLGLSGARLTLTPDGALPPANALGIKVAALSFLADPDGPVRWQGPTALSPVWLGMIEATVIRELVADIAWGELDALLFDLPPGAAADKPPALMGLIPDLAGAVAVTTSSPVAIEVVRRSLLYARDLGIPLLGLVENMAGAFTGSCEDLAAELGIPVLARIPFDRELAASLDSGVPLPESHPISNRFLELARILTAPGGLP